MDRPQDKIQKAKSGRLMDSFESGNLDMNAGDEEKFKSHRYFGNKAKFFWKEIRKLFQI